MAKRGRPMSYDGSEVNSELGFYLGSARIAKGLSLTAVGESIGVKAQFISNIEHGRAPLPAKYVNQIATLLGLESKELAAFAIKQTRAYRDYNLV